MPIIDFYARSESDVVTFSKTQINFSASLVEKIKLLDCDFARIGVDPELRRIYFAFQKDAGPGLQKLFRQLAGARPPQYSSPQHDVPTSPLTHNGGIPLYSCPSEASSCYVDCQAIFREAPFLLSFDSWRCSWQRSSRVASWARMGPSDGSSEHRKQPCCAQLYDCYPNETTFTQPAIRGHKPQEIYSL